MDRYSEQLALEAVSVGALLVPWTYVISGIIYRLPVSEFTKSPLSVFVAGAGFHLACEFSGLNDYYLKHSAAHMHHMRKWMASCKSKQKSRKKQCGIYFME
jgi:hypothetical protein